MDWKPHKKARTSDEKNDDDDDVSTDDSELNLLKEEAEEFIRNASVNHSRPAKKKARLHLHDTE